ncbi:hypothetical protein [Candidatus Magnetaquicoccus inordinatus]|uniref:hypothetical protein n=1 Tax=Candidatus Magnetaquicoccus inordinatus TaxID=2496818 RepID=UPI00102C0CD5|nr:hypothetical protein [Candidatus Magnetaquicoccus inordinatus]
MTDTVSRAVEIAQIVNVLLDGSFVRYADVNAAHMEQDLEGAKFQLKRGVRDSWFVTSDDDTEVLLCVRFDFGLRIMHKSAAAAEQGEEQGEGEEFGRIEASFVGHYLLTGEKPEPDTVKQFSHTVGMLNVWPYWREHAHSLARQMGWKNVIVPLFKLRFKNDEP